MKIFGGSPKKNELQERDFSLSCNGWYWYYGVLMGNGVAFTHVEVPEALNDRIRK